jgi:DNA-directed RNA polymerase subunit RPC12/RpoP
MRKSDVQCTNCGAGYRRIELASRKGEPGTYHCLVCKSRLETFDGSHEIAYRLTVIPQRPASRGEKETATLGH